MGLKWVPELANGYLCLSSSGQGIHIDISQANGMMSGELPVNKGVLPLKIFKSKCNFR